MRWMTRGIMLLMAAVLLFGVVVAVFTAKPPEPERIEWQADPVLPVSAAETVQTLLVTQDGCYLYTGEQAQTAYEQYLQRTWVSNVDHRILSTPMAALETTGAPSGQEPQSFGHSYRFVPDKQSGRTVWGEETRISDQVWANSTEIAQSGLFSGAASASGWVNPELKGLFLEAVQAKIGTEYRKQWDGEVASLMPVAPGKRMWIQYRPAYLRYIGTAQQYRNQDGTVTESQPVEVLQVSAHRVPMFGGGVLPTGVYRWCQDNEVNSAFPPLAV